MMEIEKTQTIITVKGGAVVIASERPVATHFLSPSVAREWASGLLRQADLAEQNLQKASEN